MTRGGFTVWMMGLSGAGTTTITQLLEHELHARGRAVEVLDSRIAGHITDLLSSHPRLRQRVSA